eukprot:3416778-Pleurochrysis_carterae.AAC.1
MQGRRLTMCVVFGSRRASVCASASPAAALCPPSSQSSACGSAKARTRARRATDRGSPSMGWVEGGGGVAGHASRPVARDGDASLARCVARRKVQPHALVPTHLYLCGSRLFVLHKVAAPLTARRVRLAAKRRSRVWVACGWRVGGVWVRVWVACGCACGWRVGARACACACACVPAARHRRAGRRRGAASVLASARAAARARSQRAAAERRTAAARAPPRWRGPRWPAASTRPNNAKAEREWAPSRLFGATRRTNWCSHLSEDGRVHVSGHECAHAYRGCCVQVLSLIHI